MKIAITGTIGSGKSTVISYIKDKGYKVFDCDEYAHELLRRKDVIKLVTKEFDCLENGEISRKKLGRIVFNDDEALDKLNSIIHPLVREKILTLESPIFVDIPLLFEAKMENLFDKIITVVADRDIIIKRLLVRDNMSKKDAIRRITLQIDENIKKNGSDYVIINDSTLEKLYSEVELVLGGIGC